MSKFFEIAAHASTSWEVTALAIAAVVYLTASRRRGKVSLITGGAIAAIVLLGIVPVIAQWRSLAVYRVRVNVISPEGTPVEEARVWSSMGGEPKKVASGWEFDIPAATRTADGRLTIWASLDAAYWRASQEVQLGRDLNRAITIQLEGDKSANVRGVVLDRGGLAIVGSRVSVAGYESESVLTQAGGNFVLPAHAAHNQNVLLHVEAKGHASATQYQPAGDNPATIVLDRQ